MGKGKKGGKRMNKAQLTEKLQEFFASKPGETLSFKEIFRGPSISLRIRSRCWLSTSWRKWHGMTIWPR